MTINSASLKEIERRAYRSTFEDGIYDIQFGCLFLVFALIPVLQAIGISRFAGYSLLIVPMIIPWLGKRYITIPRMGQVEFGPARRKKKRIGLLIGAVILFLTLPLLFMIGRDSISEVMGWKMIAIFAAPLLVLAVYTTDFPRLYIYVALLIAGVVEAEFLLDILGDPLNTIYSFGLPGVVITLIGLYLLVKFIRTYPRSEVSDVR